MNRRSLSKVGGALASASLGALLLGACGQPEGRSAQPPSSSSSEVAAAPLAIEGKWSDGVGDAPWAWVEIVPDREGAGRLVLGPARVCPSPPCASQGEGTYELVGRRLRLHAKNLEKTYEVRLAEGVMEWREDDIAIRRFHQVKPSPPAPRRPPYPDPRAARPKGTPCDELTAQGCMQATDCVLVPPDGGGIYVCRPAQGPCEGGVAQVDPKFEADCTSRSPAPANARGGGCVVQEPKCFCPNARTKVSPAPGSPEAEGSNVACACGGGPMVQCVPTR